MTGLVLMGTGGWMFYQYQLEASKPPPARILEVSAPDPTGTPSPPPSPTQVKPTPTLPMVETTIITVEPGPTATRPPASRVAMLDVLPTKKIQETSTPAPTTTPTNTFTPEATSTPTIVPEPPATATAVLSLADNPLMVQEEMLTPVAMENTSETAVTPATSPPTRIVAESIGLDAKVVEVGWEQVVRNGVAFNVWVVADYAAGWHRNSALPGQGGNIVLSGHHNIKGEVFRYTIDMNIGDIITLYVGDQPYQYAVVDKFIVKDKDEPEAVRRENAKWIGPFNEERLTLVTCWPYTNNTHRAIVIARPLQVVQTASN